MDYEPLDLGAWCNVDAAAFVTGMLQPQFGEQTFRGLPFRIGTSQGTAGKLIGFESSASCAQRLDIPVGKPVTYLIFAHVMVDPTVEDSQRVGQTLWRYMVTFEDGSNETLAVRDRFEVTRVPATWGLLPFLALPDTNDQMHPRYEGSYKRMGQRLVEVIWGREMGYFLWAWRNPRPQAPIRSIRVEPMGVRFMLGGITLSHVEEFPFTRQVRKPVKLTLPRAADAEKEFKEFEVEVDRGVATYPHPLPAEDAEAFMNAERKGFGEAKNLSASPVYVEIAGTPSATVRVKHDGEELGQVNWGALQEAGRAETERVHFEVVESGKNWVHVTVVDEETGKPTPCRVHFRSPQGVPYQPHGHHNQLVSNLSTHNLDIGGDLRMGQATYAYIDGRCQGWLPRGEVIVDVAKGFEYEPLRAKVQVKPGQRELTLHIKRWMNMSARRWFSGDPHVHFLAPQGAHREAQGEDLNVVNLLATQWGHVFTNVEDFTGRPSVSDDGKTIVYCTQENRQHLLGHLTLLGLKEPVYPLCSDGPSESEIGGSLDITMSHWADACRAQGGTVILPHMPVPDGEPAAMIATGRIDAVEMIRGRKYYHNEYYRYLNCGYKLPLVGGTDKMSSEVPVGLYRAYVQIPADQPFNYDTWCAGIRAGRTFLSGGPILRFTVNGAAIGDTLRLPGNGGTVEVEAVAESIFPIRTLQIVQAGNVVAQVSDAKGSRRLHLKEKLKVERHTWLAARCGGLEYYPGTHHHDVWNREMFAHTSPIYVAVGGEWWMFDQATAEYMLTLIDGCVQHIRHTAHHHEPGTVTHHHGLDDHQAYLEEPFRQAAEAIHKRMHALGIPH